MDDSKDMSFISAAEKAIESINDLEGMRTVAKEILEAYKTNSECYKKATDLFKKATDLLEKQHQIIERYDKLTTDILFDRITNIIK